MSNDAKVPNNVLHTFGRESYKLLGLILNTQLYCAFFVLFLELELTSMRDQLHYKAMLRRCVVLQENIFSGCARNKDKMQSGCQIVKQLPQHQGHDRWSGTNKENDA